jgi:hypothetical protein
MTHIDDDTLVAFAMSDTDAGTSGAIDAHLDECEVCRAAVRDVRAVLDVTAHEPIPERGEDYGAQVWARLEPQLSAAGHGWRWQTWGSIAAAMLLAVSAFVAGRFGGRPEPATPVRATATAQAPASVIRERVMLAALGDHLDRTERALVEIVNTDTGGRVDISAEQAWARDLLDANRLYRQAARGTSAPALGSLLDELEPVLMEIANSPSRLSAEEFSALRLRIEDRSLVFKVRVSGADVRARQRALIHPGESQS